MKTFIVLVGLLCLPCISAAEVITFLQPSDCSEIAKWELWAQKNGEPSSTKRADVPLSSLAGPCSETDANVATISTNLKRGTYAFTLRAVGVGDGETADSNVLSVRFPLTKPTQQTITR